jgi:hypothetical protein
MTRLGDCRRTAVAAVSSVALVALMGCGQILGVDEYRVADAPPVSACASPNAPAGPGGKCTAVGVTECAKGLFTSDGHGGCDPVLPKDRCRPGNQGLLGSNYCTALQICFSRYEGGLTTPGAARWYVDQAAHPVGDGTTPDTPFGTIMDAVHAAGLQPATIFIAPGEYRETIVVKAPLLLLGACPGGTADPPTTLRPPDGALGPVVQFSATADATTEAPTSAGIGYVEIVGGTVGVEAKGPNLAFGMGALWVHDVLGPGVSLADGVTAIGHVLASAGRLLIENNSGAGIALDGATLDEAIEIVVRGTRPLANGQGGYGIALHSSRALARILDTANGAPTRVASAPSSITLDRAVLDENAGAGLFVEGSTAMVTRSIIRNTRANGLGEGRGVVVQQRALGPIAASLDLTQSVVEGSFDVGVLVVDSPARLDGTVGVRAHIENTTIRDVAGVAAPEGTPCLGNGLRVRADGAASDTAQIVLKNSLIEGAHEAGVQVQGARVDVLDSIVRGTAACTSDFGDGIDVLGDLVAPARVTVAGSRIEASARAGVASFGADLSVASSVIDGGGATPVASVARGGAPAKVSVQSSVCTAGSARTSCEAKKATFAPSLVGGNGCEPFKNDGVCFSRCYENVYDRLTAPNPDPSKAVTPIQGVVTWAPNALQIAASFTNAEGCVEWGGLPRSATQVWANAVDGYVPTTWWQTTGAGDTKPQRTGLLRNDLFMGIPGIVQPPPQPSLDYDARMAPLPAVVVCQPPDPSAKSNPNPTDLCVGRGVADLTLKADSSGAAGPFYVTAAGLPEAPQPGQSTTSAPYTEFVNAPPGDFVVHIGSPTGGSVQCTAKPFDDGWATGDLQGNNIVTMPARPGFNTVAFAFCTVE